MKTRRFKYCEVDGFSNGHVTRQLTMLTKVVNALKFIFFPNGWVLAHVSRMVEVAKALRAQGHEVLFAGEHRHPRSYLHTCETDGFRTVPCMEFDWPYIWNRYLKYNWLFVPWDILSHQKFAPLDGILEAQVELIRAEQPDMVVCDGTFTLTSAAYITQTPATGIMNAYFTHFYRPGSLYRPMIDFWDWVHLSPIRNRVFRKYGVEPVDAKALFWSTPIISPGLEEFDAYIKDYEHWEAVGPIWGKLPGDRPDWLETLDDGTPNVYVTFGSTGDLDKFLRASYGAMAGAPYRFVVTTGRQVSEETKALAPGNVLLADYAPGDEIIKHCEALVFHGGNGSMYQALAAGVPMLALPHTLEQDINARLCDIHGFGIRMKPRHARGANLLRALDRLLGDSSYGERARYYAGQIQEAPGVHRAAEIILEGAKAGIPPHVKPVG